MSIVDMMQQAAAMRDNMQRAQRELAAMEVRGEAGGGLVCVTMSCRYDARKVEIAAELMRDDREVLQDLIVAAINDAARKVTQATQEKMGTAAADLGGLDLSAFKLPG